MEKKNQVSFFHSISWKVTLLVIGVVLLSALGSLLTASSQATTVVEEVNENYILSMAETAAELVEMCEVTGQDYGVYLADIMMTGIDSSYAYLVSPDGIMLYHPTAEKIGATVENAVISEVVAKL